MGIIPCPSDFGWVHARGWSNYRKTQDFSLVMGEEVFVLSLNAGACRLVAVGSFPVTTWGARLMMYTMSLVRVDD